MLIPGQADPELNEVAPGLLRYELKQACRKLRGRTSGSNTRGFTLAFATTEPAALGFNFYMHEYDYAVTIHAVTGDDGLFKFTGPFLYSDGRNDDDSAADTFFRQSSRVMGVSYVDLVKFIADQRSEWRFEGWVDGKPGRYEDNGRMWNPRLWNRIVDTIDQGRMPIYHLPPKARLKLVDYMRGHAREGVVVLDK